MEMKENGGSFGNEFLPLRSSIVERELYCKIPSIGEKSYSEG